jgi:hypothetical protein
MVFTYDKNADREVVRFTAQGLVLGLITGHMHGLLAMMTKQPLLTGAALIILTFIALFPREKWAKILYWPLAILLHGTGILVFGILGALIGFVLWFVALRIVPWLRYVLQKENVISVCVSAVVAWLLTVAIWGVGLTQPGNLAKASLLEYAALYVLIGCVFWGLAKIISSGFKEYHFRQGKK